MWVLLACVSLPDPPQILSVQPGYGYRGEETAIAITGENFFPQLTIDGSAPGAGQVDDGVQVWLWGPQTFALSATLEDYGRISAVVPSGLPVDSYNLRVRMPSGEEVDREGVYRVTDTRADHLALQVESAAWSVGEEAELQIVLEDPEGRAVAQSLQVEVVGSPSREDPDFAFVAGGLEAQEEMEDGVRGWLSGSGSGRLRVASMKEDDISFTVRPVLEADRIEEATQLLSWEPGGLAGARLSRVPSPETVIAGETFSVEVELVDAVGTVLEEETASVILFESTGCGSWYTTVTVRGRDQVPVQLESACESNVIQAFVAGSIAETDAFDVVAGPLAGFAVTVPATEVVAGSGRLAVLVEALDAWGNRVVDHVAPVRLRDGLGGLDTETGVGGGTCTDFLAGQQICSLALMVAGEGDQLEAVYAEASGVSGPFRVLPDAATQVSVTIPAIPVEAGAGFDVEVAQTDAWGNGVAFDPLALLSDDTGTLACDAGSPAAGGAAGAWRYGCAVTAATGGTVISAAVTGPDGALSGSSLPLVVVNAALAVVEVVAPEEVVAGEPFAVRLQGYDVWGNPYVTQTATDVELSDLGGTLAGTVWTLDAAGAAAGDLVLTAAGTERIAVTQAGGQLGESAPFAVAPGMASQVLVGTGSYVEAGTSTVARLEAVDVWGNRVEDYAGSGVLWSQQGGCEGAAITGFAGGTAEIAVDCVTPVLGEVLEVSVTGTSGSSLGAEIPGSSGTFDVVDLGCVGGPSLSLWLEGDPELIVCQVGGVATVEGLVTGSGTPVLYHYTVSGYTGSGGPATEVRRTLSAAEIWSWSEPGRYVVEAVGVDAAGCADRTEAVAWVGAEDGSATGPVTVTPLDSAVADGSQTSVQLSATDCSGDPAAGSLQVQADLGALAATATGSGLTVLLDAAGEGSVDWAFSAGYAGIATVRAGNASSLGEAALTVTGDTVRPFVESVTPSGYVSAGDSAALSSFLITFSEPMLSTTMLTSAISLEGSVSGAVPLSLSLSGDQRQVTLLPGTTPDPAEQWRLTLTTDLRDDAAGNRLSGDWSGGAVTFTGWAGAVPVSTTGVDCAASVARFYPDGDPGAGEEAEEVEVSLSAPAPQWWRLTVVPSASATGEAIRILRVAGTATSVAWDGRGGDGRIVGPGNYLLSVEAVDGYENMGAPCTVGVDVARHVGG